MSRDPVRPAAAPGRPLPQRPEPEYATEADIAAMFAISVHTVRELRYAGKLPAFSQNGRMIRIPIAAARAYFTANTVGGDGLTAGKGRCGVWDRPGRGMPRRRERPRIHPERGGSV